VWCGRAEVPVDFLFFLCRLLEDGASMKRIRTAIGGVRTFVNEVVGEMKKSTWPERQELVESTVVVVVSVLLLGAFVGVSDKVLATLLRILV
jgi:preprotein translocase subunit SecE